MRVVNNYDEYVKDRLKRNKRRNESCRTLNVKSPISPHSPLKKYNAEFEVSVRKKQLQINSPVLGPGNASGLSYN